MLEDKNHYREISPSRAWVVERYLGKNIRELNVIEFGCASGLTLAELKERYSAKVKGFDLKPIHNLDFEIKPLDLNAALSTDYRSEVSDADLIVMFDVLEHLQNPRGLLNDVFATMKSGSDLILISPNFASVRFLKAWFDGIVPDEESGFFDKTHLKWLSRGWIESQFGTAMKQDIFYIYSKNKLVASLQKTWPSRLCSQFGCVLRK